MDFTEKMRKLVQFFLDKNCPMANIGNIKVDYNQKSYFKAIDMLLEEIGR